MDKFDRKWVPLKGTTESVMILESAIFCRWHQVTSHGWHMGLSEHSGVPRIPVEGTLRSTRHDGGTGVLKHNWQLIGDGGSYCFTIAIIPT
jgi:hypothetical protein